jgi:tetratricopeptide (TPR) repeat protein
MQWTASPKLLCIVFLILITFTLSAQKRPDRIEALESIMVAFTSVDNTRILPKKLPDLLSRDKQHLDQQDIQIVYKVIQANSRALVYDKLNPESDKLFQSAIETAQRAGKEDLLIWGKIAYGFYLYTYRIPLQAMPHFVKAMHLIEKMPALQIPNAADTYKKIGYFTMTMGQPQRAIGYLDRARQYARPASYELGDIVANIGRCHFLLEDYAKAKSYFQQALTLSQASGDYIREAQSWGDLAQIYQLNKQYDQADQALARDLSLSEQYGDQKNTMFATILQAKHLLERNKVDGVGALLDKAMTIALSKPYFKTSEYDIVKLQIALYSRNNNTMAELTARRRLDNLEIALAKLDGKVVIQQASLEAQKKILQLSLEAEQHKFTQEKFIRNAVVAICLLFIVVLLFVVIVYRKRNKLRLTNYENKVMMLQLEKVTSENKLNATRNTLTTYRDYLFEKNNQIDALQLEIKKIKNSPLSFIETHKGKLQALLQSHLMSEVNWQTFKKLFAEEESGYFQYIMGNFPDLTESNLRILFLQKMGFNNPKVAQILGITLDAVKKNKQRMRKKYGDTYTQFLETNRFGAIEAGN